MERPLGPTVLQLWMTAGDDIAPWVVGTQCGARIIVSFKATDGATHLAYPKWLSLMFLIAASRPGKNVHHHHNHSLSTPQFGTRIKSVPRIGTAYDRRFSLGKCLSLMMVL